MATTPRVAVVGGGLAGTLCSLVLRNRGIQPRILLQEPSSVGWKKQQQAPLHIPFLQGSSNPHLTPVLNMLEQHGLLAEWKGRFGMLGSNKRGFLPSEVVTATVQRNKHDHEPTKIGWTKDSGDYMGFVSNSREKTYVGVPSMSDLLRGIWRKADIEVLPDTQVRAAETVEGGGWRLETSNGDTENHIYDGLVFADSDPILASSTVRSIAHKEQEAAENVNGQNRETGELYHRLIQLANDLQRASDDSDNAAVYILEATFPETVQVPFDAVSVHGSLTIQFMARESSKPGTDHQKQNDWTAISTSQFAQGHQSTCGDYVNEVLGQELARLLSTNDDQEAVKPLHLTSELWQERTASNLRLKEDSVTLAPWRLVICGDYVSQAHATPTEAAALSGLEAGERAAAFFAHVDTSSL